MCPIPTSLWHIHLLREGGGAKNFVSAPEKATWNKTACSAQKYEHVYSNSKEG